MAVHAASFHPAQARRQRQAMARPWTPGPIALITSPPKVIWEERVALAQLCNKVAVGYNGTPKFTPKQPLPLR